MNGKNKTDVAQQTKDRLKRIEAHDNVTGVLLVKRTSEIIHSTLENTQALEYAQKCALLEELARNIVRETDPTDDMQFLRIRTKKNEMIIAPERQNELTLIVLQNSALRNESYKFA